MVLEHLDKALTDDPGGPEDSYRNFGLHKGTVEILQH
jgi:hypothetical protein